MKALSLTQPWASLAAVGAKTIETRGWRTPYRGLLAIHASKGYPEYALMSAITEPIRSALLKHGIDHNSQPDYQQSFASSIVLKPMPFGEVIAVCRLRNCIPTEEAAQHISDQERAFGNYARGRWAWVLSDIRQLIHTVPARGSLGLWEWEPGPDWERALGVAKEGEE